LLKIYNYSEINDNFYNIFVDILKIPIITHEHINFIYDIMFLHKKYIFHNETTEINYIFYETVFSFTSFENQTIHDITENKVKHENEAINFIVILIKLFSNKSINVVSYVNKGERIFYI